jgi:hypothetical protein
LGDQLADTTTTPSPAQAAASAQLASNLASAASPLLRKPIDPQVFVAGFVLTAFVGAVILLCWHVLPEGNATALDILIGVLGTNCTAVVNYFFGSSSSSKAKDATIGAMAGAAGLPPTG